MSDTSSRATQQILGGVFEAVPFALVVVDRSGVIRFCNVGAAKLFGYSQQELVGSRVERLVPESVRDKHPRLRERFFGDPSPRAMGGGRELFACRKDFSRVPVEIGLSTLRVGEEDLVAAVIVDITQRRQLERKFEITVEASPVAMILCEPSGLIALANREASRMFRFAPGELLGKPVDTLVPPRLRVQDAAERRRFFHSSLNRHLGSDGRRFQGLRSDGTEFPIEVGVNPVMLEDGTHMLITIIDTTERLRLEQQVKRSQEDLEKRVVERTAELAKANLEKEILLRDLEHKRSELERLSREDPLTGLGNRRDFDTRLADAILQAERHNLPLTVAMFDLDRFKLVNDRFGHAVGDDVLRETANIMRRECRAIDVVARYGGEEFALAFPRASVRDALVICDRMRRAFEQFDWNTIAAGESLTISAGIAEWSVGEDSAALLAAADANLYEAKRGGRNRCVA